jgi:hypothetical protein
MRKVTIKATPKIVELACEAYSIQDACNTCGLAQRFAEVLIELGCDSSTCGRNQHPITKIWIDKFCHLAHMRQDLGAGFWEQNTKLMKGEDVEVEVWDL